MPIPSRRVYLMIALMLVAYSPRAQEVERDFSKYVRPFLFVLPKLPETLDAASRKFTARVNISADGSVEEPVQVFPNELAVITAVNEVARFWLFYPELTGDCKPSQRAGKVEFEFDGSEGRAWLEVLALAGITERSSAIVSSMTNESVSPKYPIEELGRGIRGQVIVAMKLLPDGTTAEHVVYFAAPRNRNFARVSLRHANGFRARLDAPLPSPHACILVPYRFDVQ